MAAQVPARPVSPVLKALMFAPLAAAAGYTGLTLTLFSGSTDTFFAWRTSPVTAVLLGAAYLGACAMLVLALRTGEWARVRVTTAGSALLMLLMLGATWSGRGTTHLGGGPIVAFFAAWIWLGVHLSAPLIGLAALSAQWRVPGPAPERAPRLPWWVAAPMVGNGLAVLVAGAALYAVPGTLARHWPWQATALDVRSLGAWCLTFGTCLLLSRREAELRRVRGGMAALVTTGVLGLLGLIRYGDLISWSSLGAWALLILLLTFTGLGLSGFGVSWMLDPPEHPAPRVAAPATDAQS